MRILTTLIAATICFAPVAAQETVDSGELVTGLKFLDEQTYRSIPLAATPLMGDLPADVDMAGDFPIPGFQGSQPSCVGWAVAYALKSYQERRERNWTLDSTSRTFSPAFIYNQIKLNSNCSGGSHFTDALNVLRRDGVATLADFPYNPSDCAAMPSAIVKQNARAFSVADWRRINVQDEIELKTQLAAGFPVMVGALVDGRFQALRAGQKFTGTPGPQATGHAMVVVGYSDSRQAFKLINSWGTGWGDGGFGWVDYAAFRAMTREGYVVQDVVAGPTPTPTPTPNPNPGPGPTPYPWPNPNPGPMPIPLPNPVVSLGFPGVIHNQLLPSPGGPVPGMTIPLSGRVQNARGQQLTLVARFSFFQGAALFANQADPTFRDPSGVVATGTLPLPVGVDDAPIDGLFLTIPYQALNLQPTGGQNTYFLSFNVVASLNGQPVAQSAQVPFQIRW